MITYTKARFFGGLLALVFLSLPLSFLQAAEALSELGLASEGLKVWQTQVDDINSQPTHKAAVLGPPDPDTLPDGRVAQGSGLIRLAYLIYPTDRYGHAVLGDGLEAAGLRVITAEGQTVDFQLPEDSVFEDLRPRLADLDGDGQDEIILVRSYQDRGAALAVIGLVGQELKVLAETPAIGLSYRWLNPAGVGDFNGDGLLEVAYVETPHIGGTLRFWRFERQSEGLGQLRQLDNLSGFSNHAIGSRALGLSFVLAGKVGQADKLILPSADRRSLLVVGWSDAGPEILARQNLMARVVSDFVAPSRQGEGGELFRFTLSDGREILVTGGP